MGKARRKFKPKVENKRPDINRKQQFVTTHAVKAFSDEGNVILQSNESSESRSNLSKKLKRKIKHDSFVKKVISKPTKKKINALNNVSALRSEINEIRGDLLKQDESKMIPSAFSKPNSSYFVEKKVDTKKKRQNTKKNEMQRFKAVLNHSVFQEDPLSAVQQHLSNTFKSKE